MDANSGVELCRVTVVAPRTRMDLALPTDTPLADLLPTLLRYAGENPDDPAFLRGGWVLQRLGESAFDPSLRLSGLGIKDGDVLHLRHRESAIPEFAFDDVADAIAVATRERRSAWQPSDARLAALVVAGTFFVLGALVVLLSGPSWVLPTVVALVGSVGFVAGGMAMSRAFSQARVGALLGAAGVGYAAIGGLVALGGDKPLSEFGAAQLLMAFALALVMAVVAGFAIVANWDGFFGAATAALMGILACVAILVFSASAAAAAAVAVAVALAAVPFLPTLCGRLAQLPIPQLPTSSEDLRRQTDVLPGPTVLQQAITADKLVAALIASTTAVGMVGSIFLTQEPGWFGPALTGVTSLALYLRSRHFRGRTHRLWLICGGVVTTALLAYRLAVTDEGGLMLLAVGIPCLAVAAGLGAWAVSMPGRRLSPYWGRSADLFEVFVLLSVVPLALGAVGVYTAILELFG
ncbi:type VII secretion integral membrane protein EccD [Actinopolymorpha alba]|uniref:type VII secretion integral membrane protein EccD n=1 Tax=Actinopolymorpha alba TaxID=533267 RepID=UPI00037A5A6D|nr:type VII secretion integral membrane protein EccD [Actinopolymorpha alba]